MTPTPETPQADDERGLVQRLLEKATLLALIALFLGVLALLTPSTVRAQTAKAEVIGADQAAELPARLLPIVPLLRTDLPDAQKRTRRIALLPIKNLLVRGSELFARAVPRTNVADLVALERRVLAALRSRDFVDVMSPAAVRRRLNQDPAVVAIGRAAQARYRLGLEYYLGLSTVQAIQSLEESVRLYESVFQDVSAPKSYADAQFMLGVSLVDAGNVLQGHVALKAAFAIQPSRQFRPRFFQPRVEQALHAAANDFLSTGQHSRPYGKAARLARLARRLHVDAIVTVAMRYGADHNPEVLLSAYHVRTHRFEAEVQLPITATATKMEPALTRWLDCLPIRPRLSARLPRSTQPLFMDTSAAYALYLRQPTRQLFHSLGFAAGLAQQVRPGLEWFVRMNMFTSLSDPYRDVLQSFNSVRFIAGIGFALQLRYIRLWVRPGLDLHTFGRFTATTDPNCKLFGLKHRLCNAKTVRSLEQNVLAGFHLALGGDVPLGRRFFVTARVSGTAYILPLSSVNELNYPLGIEAGLGYRF